MVLDIIDKTTHSHSVSLLKDLSKLHVITHHWLKFFTPVMRYCESSENAQSHTHLWLASFRVFLSKKSAVCHMLTVVSADAVAKKLQTTRLNKTGNWFKLIMNTGLQRNENPSPQQERSHPWPSTCWSVALLMHWAIGEAWQVTFLTQNSWDTLQNSTAPKKKTLSDMIVALWIRLLGLVLLSQILGAVFLPRQDRVRM